METFYALLALCAGNSPVAAQRPVTPILDVFFDLRHDPRQPLTKEEPTGRHEPCEFYDIHDNISHKIIDWWKILMMSQLQGVGYIVSRSEA